MQEPPRKSEEYRLTELRLFGEFVKHFFELLSFQTFQIQPVYPLNAARTPIVIKLEKDIEYYSESGQTLSICHA